MNIIRLILLTFWCSAFIMAGVASGQTGFGEIQFGSFADPEVCGGCHNKNFEEWKGSMHAASSADPFYQRSYSRASDATEGAVDDYCPRCHSPINYVTGKASKVFSAATDETNSSEKGVNCDFCHTVTGKAGSGNGLYISSPGRTKYGPWADAESPYHGAQFSDIHTKSDFCGICHYQTHSVNGVVIQNTFQEWLDSPYFEAGTQCQHCHMTPGAGYTVNPGNSTPLGPERPHVWTHNTAGGNVFQTRIQSPKHRVLAIEMLKAAATLEVRSELLSDELILLNATVTNSGAGHSIPTGSNALRQIWLEVVATDEKDNTIYRSGWMDDAGTIDPAAIIYGSVYYDESGKVTLNEWEAAAIASDMRIRSGKSVTQQHQITIPKGYSGPVRINTRLLYRTAPQGYIDDLFGIEAEDVPVVEMATKQQNIREPEEGVPGFEVMYTVITISLLVMLLRKRE